MANSPRWSFTAEGRYHIPTAEAFGDFYLTADHYYIGKQYQEGFVLLPAHTLTSFNAQWLNAYKKGVDVTLFLDNAFNIRYIHQVGLSTASFGLFTGDYGPPRMFGVRLRYNFGS